MQFWTIFPKSGIKSQKSSLMFSYSYRRILCGISWRTCFHFPVPLVIGPNHGELVQTKNGDTLQNLIVLHLHVLVPLRSRCSSSRFEVYRFLPYLQEEISSRIFCHTFSTVTVDAAQYRRGIAPLVWNLCIPIHRFVTSGRYSTRICVILPGLEENI